MSNVNVKIARRQLARLMLVTTGLAPVVTIVLLGLSRLQRDTPEWVYWQAELILLLTIEFAYKVTAIVSLSGTLVLAVLYVRRRSRGASRPLLARGLSLCLALVCGLVMSEAVCAAWIARSHRAATAPAEALAPGVRNDSPLRFAEPQRHIDLRREFPDPPGDRQIDIVVMGESSAEGVPYKRWVSIGKIIAWKLQEAIPQRPVELNVIALAGDTLERQHLTLCNIDRRPDLLIIYCGHNEFYSRLWWASNIDHYGLDKTPAIWNALGEKFARYSSVGSLIRETANRCRIAIPPPIDTGRRRIDVPTYTSAEYALLLSDFGRRLDELVSYAEQVGALPVLILPPANDAGFDPNRSFLPATTTPSERSAFERDLVAATQLEAVDPAAARTRFKALIARQPCFAETHYRLARLHQQAGDWDDAYREYVAARDLDGMPMRCPSPFQQAYRDVAARHDCILIDGQSYFHAIGHHGLLDDELFQDAMHPSLRGQIALAQAVAIALRTRQAFGWPADAPPPVVDPAACAARFGIDTNAWLQIALWWKGFNELMAPMRYDTSQRSRKRDAGIAAVAQIKAGVRPEATGLPNVGVPLAVPVFDKAQPLPPMHSPGILPCFD